MKEAKAGGLPRWVCQVEGEPKDQQWTVGEIFRLSCEGPGVQFQSTNLSFSPAPNKGDQDTQAQKRGETQKGEPRTQESPYQLKILGVEQQRENSLEIKATSYVPKTHRFKAWVIKDQGKVVAEIEPFSLPVKTVITDPQQKPYGPAGAFSLGYPLYLWVILGGVLLLSLLWGLFWMGRQAQMRRVIEKLKEHNTALGAFNQFNKDVRLLGRQYLFGEEDSWPGEKKKNYVKTLDELFRMYLLREFYVPALEWTSSLMLKAIAKQDKKDTITMDLTYKSS